MHPKNGIERKEENLNVLIKTCFHIWLTGVNLLVIITCKLGKPMPTTKFAIQLTKTAMAIALGRGPCENSSAVIIHGMEPGPTAKNTTNANVDITDK